MCFFVLIPSQMRLFGRWGNSLMVTPLFAGKRLGYRLPDFPPTWHSLEFPPYGSIIEQEQQEEEEEDAGVCRPAINLLDAYLGHLGHEAFHVARNVKRHPARCHVVYGRTIVSHVVGQVIPQPSCVNGRAYHAAHHHVEHVEHGKRLEEVLEGHDLFQTGHERDTEHGVSKAAAEGGEVELGQVDV